MQPDTKPTHLNMSDRLKYQTLFLRISHSESCSLDLRTVDINKADEEVLFTDGCYAHGGKTHIVLDRFSKSDAANTLRYISFDLMTRLLSCYAQDVGYHRSR